VQGLILEDNGYRCGEGALYFRESREGVRVAFDDSVTVIIRDPPGWSALAASAPMYCASYQLLVPTP
jgi:CRISPR-associated exonuclease Cas4/CRISPR-associated protein Cas1